MRNFQCAFKARKQSFISPVSSCMTVPLITSEILLSEANEQTIQTTFFRTSHQDVFLQVDALKICYDGSTFIKKGRLMAYIFNTNLLPHGCLSENSLSFSEYLLSRPLSDKTFTCSQQ